MFVRKLYYDLATGNVVESHMRQGSVRMTTFSEDVAALTTLTGRTEADTGCMVWTEPDAEIEAGFEGATGVSVDVTQDPPVIVWGYTPIDTETEPDAATMEAALNELGVQTRES